MAILYSPVSRQVFQVPAIRQAAAQTIDTCCKIQDAMDGRCH